MNLLAVSYMLPPHLYPQAIQVGRMLYHLAASARVGVVCGKLDQLGRGVDCYPDFDTKLVFRLEVPYRPLLKGLVHRLACYGVPFYGRTPDEFRGWIALAERAVSAYLPQVGFAPDVLMTFGEPMSDHLLGLRLQKRLHLPWIAHFSDPWVDSPFRRRHFLANWVNGQWEAQVVKNADRVIFTSEETRALVMRKYPKSLNEKVRILPHGYEPDFYRDAVPCRRGPLVVRYVGNFYGHRSPGPLFDALAVLHRRSFGEMVDLRVELVGHIPGRMLISSSHRRLPKGLVKTIPTVSYSRSLQLMREADLLLAIDAPDETSVFLPSKLVDYLGAGVPILGIVPPGTSAHLIERLGGRVANPRCPDQVATALAAAIALARQWRAAGRMDPWGNSTVRSEYQVSRVAQRMREIIGEVVA